MLQAFIRYMTNINMIFPFYFWVIFGLLLIGSIILDLVATSKKTKNHNFKTACIETSFWVILALSFGIFVYLYAGHILALEYLAGYFIELSLSIDNVFVFIMIFAYFKISPQYQHRILFWGIFGAIVMRLIMILGAVELFKNFKWLFAIFGIILIISAIKILKSHLHDTQVRPNSNNIIKFIHRFFPIDKNAKGDHFFVYNRSKKKWLATPAFVALLIVEKSDLIFAIDSIPAVLAVTQEPFIVFTSNIFAILGLRSLYFVLIGFVDKFKYLKYGISAILVFIGIKMIIMVFGIHIPIQYSLLVIVTLLSSSCAVSLFSKNSK